MTEVPKNIAMDILRIGEANPRGAAFILPGRVVSHAEFRSMILMNALHMQARGVQPGSHVAISVGSSLPLGLSLLLGCALLGASWIAGAPDVLQQEKRLTHIFHDEAGRPSDNPRVARVDATWTRPPQGFDHGRGLHFPGFNSDAATFFVAMSSGTTGERKFIEWTNGRFYGYAQEWATDIVGRARKRTSLFPNLSFLKTLHSLGTLLAGGVVIEGVSHEDLQHHKVEVVCGSPAHFSKFPWGSGNRLPMACLSGGGPTPTLLTELQLHFDVIRIDYGATEVGTVAGVDIRTAIDDPRVLRPSLSGRVVEIVDGDGTVLEPGQIGEMRIKTPFVAGAYRGDETASRGAFKNGWFYPGDLASIASDGTFRLQGRAKDQFNLGGVKFNAIEIDQIISGVHGIRDAMCFIESSGGVERLAVLVELEAFAEVAPLVEEIRKALVARRSDAFRMPLIYAVTDIPRNPNGKPMRNMVEEVEKTLLGGGAKQ